MKYCAAAAGALGLTTTDLVKLEKALATDVLHGGTQIVWLNGAACTGCTVSFANSAYYASIQDLLVPWTTVAVPAIAAADPGHTPTQILNAIDGGFLTDNNPPPDGKLDVVFMETLSSAVGSRALNGAKSVLAHTTDGSTTNGTKFVLAIEGSIQTGASGNFCRIGNGTTASDTTTIEFMNEVLEFANDDNCLAILAVGTCSSFGGIPAARGSVTGAKGLISSGRITGGYTAVNNEGLWDWSKRTAVYGVQQINLTNRGSGYTSAPTITFSGGGTGTKVNPTYTVNMGTGASTPLDYSDAAHTPIGQVFDITVGPNGSGFTSNPILTFSAPTLGSTATAVAIIGVNTGTGLSVADWTKLMSKTVCISGCPPHPDWIVGTIVYLLTYPGEVPLTDKYHRPLDFYGQYQCTNCQWKTNDPTDLGADNDILNTPNPKATFIKGGNYVIGNSPKLYKSKYNSIYEGCLGVMGCKGRKTKADCSYRRWNSDTKSQGGISWCVQTRAGCHGCTDPRYPDGWGKFFAFK